jgi:hypothetical protein
MTAKSISSLSLIVILVIAVLTYIVVLKLMWDWDQRAGRQEPNSDKFLTVLETAIVIGLLCFIGYVVLSGPKDAAQFNMVLMWGLAMEVFLAAYVSYFQHDLKTESSYLLMILLVLFAALTVKLSNLNRYGAAASLFGAVVTLLLFLKVTQEVQSKPASGKV